MIDKSSAKQRAVRYEDDPSDIKIDHMSGAPRSAVKTKAVSLRSKAKAKRAEHDDDDEDQDVVLPLDGRLAKKRKKRRAVDDDGERAPSTSRELRVREPGTLSPAKNKTKPRSIERAKKRTARIKAELPTEEELLSDLPEMADDSQERQNLNEYLHMFRKLRRLTRKAEKDCLKSNNPRGYYAVCTLYSAQREVIADIRSMSDMSNQVQYIEDHVLQPMVRSLGQNLLDSFYQMRKLLIETVKPKETQFALAKYQEITKEQGKYLQAMYEDAMRKTSNYLLGGK